MRFRSDLSQFGNVATYSWEHQAFGSHKSWCCGKTFQMGIKFGIKLKCIRISDKMGWNYIWRIILNSRNPEVLNYAVHIKTFSTRLFAKGQKISRANSGAINSFNKRSKRFLLKGLKWVKSIYGCFIMFNSSFIFLIQPLYRVELGKYFHSLKARQITFEIVIFELAELSLCTRFRKLKILEKVRNKKN